MPRPCISKHPFSPQTCRICECLSWPSPKGDKYRAQWGEPDNQLRWTYAITTVPERQFTYLPRTLDSLKTAGFIQPMMFTDYEPKIGCAGNWVRAAAELYFRDPKADRYAVFQDDVVFCKNIRQYLEAKPYPQNGYLNLYVARENQSLAPREYGFFPSNQKGKGALALVFDNQAMTALLTQGHLFHRAKSVARGKQFIDGGIVETMRLCGYQEYCHNPSLCKHIGEISSLGHQPFPHTVSFPGEDKDALCFLEKPSIGLGDLVSAALGKVGVTEERVKRWIGECGCADRKRKLNRLSEWTGLLISESVQKARETLHSLLES